MPAAAEAVRGYLADGPLKQAEIQARLAADGLPRAAWPGVQLWLDLVRVPPAGTWGTPRAHVYGLAEHTVPAPDPPPYRGRRPGAAGRAATWGPSVRPRPGHRLVLRLERHGHPRGAGRAAAAPVPRRGRWRAGGRAARRRCRRADTPAPVRFLGQWDAILLVHARRGQILPERYRPRVFATSIPQSVPTFLVDGQVAGTWRYVDGEVRCEPFHELRTARAGPSWTRRRTGWPPSTATAERCAVSGARARAGR